MSILNRYLLTSSNDGQGLPLAELLEQDEEEQPSEDSLNRRYERNKK